MWYNIDHIRHDRNIGPKSLNGPERSVSATAVDSLHLLGFGLTQLKNNTEKLGYRNINVLSSMTLSLENLDLTVNKKHGTQTVLTYIQSFASSTEESVKESAWYLTSREIWYSLLENKMKLEELKFSKRKKKFNDIIPGEKKRNAKVDIIKWCCCSTTKWKAGNYNGKECKRFSTYISFLRQSLFMRELLCTLGLIF